MNTVKTLQIEQIDAQILLDKFKSLEFAIKALNSGPVNLENDTLLTRQEVAAILKVSLVTLWSWTNKGILQSYRIGNHIRYKRLEVLNAPVPITHVGRR